MQENDKKTEGCDTELDRLEKTEKIKWKYKALDRLTIAFCVLALGSAGTFLYAYATNDRDFEEGAFGGILTQAVEVIKIVVGL